MNTTALGLLAVIVSIILLYLAIVAVQQQFYICPRGDAGYGRCTPISDPPVVFSDSYPIFIGGSIASATLGGLLFYKTRSPRENHNPANESS